MRRDPRILFGFLLILAGILFGLQELSVISGEWEDPLFALAFGVGAVFFLINFFDDRTRWWSALAGLILLGLALTSATEMLLPEIADDFGGAIFLGMIGLAFLVVYLVDRNMWWAIIPSGVMFSLTAMIAVDELLQPAPFETAGILFLGMGLTFLLLYFLPQQRENLSWSIFPAVPLLIFGLFIGFGEEQLWNYIWPALIILLGLYFLVGAMRKS